jgi:hypothetical protein
MKEKKVIKICESHPDTPTPLIYTYAFMGAEYWCPFCGYNGGFFGAGTDVPETPELKKALEKWKAHTKPYLRALSLRVCHSFLYKGKRITYKEYPENLKQKDTETIKAFSYGQDINGIK